jgi:hypothetical protein
MWRDGSTFQFKAPPAQDGTGKQSASIAAGSEIPQKSGTEEEGAVGSVGDLAWVFALRAEPGIRPAISSRRALTALDAAMANRCPAVSVGHEV